MKLCPIKQLFYTLLLLLLITSFNACTKKDIKLNQSTTKTTTTADSIVAATDSLPSFYSPTGLAIDAAGNLYVADYGNNLIRKISTTGIVSTVAGSGNQGSINATGVLASFSQPTGVAVDANGNLYIADSGNNLIREISSSGVVTTLAGGDTTGTTLNGTGLNTSFFDPVGIAVDGTFNVYVADAGNNLIRKITAAGVVTSFAGNNAADSSTAKLFNNPTGVALDTKNNVYVAGYLNDDILKISPVGAISIFAGVPDTTGSINGSGSTVRFYFPNSVAVDAANNVYVADGVNNLIRKITPTGVVSTFAGSGLAGATDSTGTAASFNGPAGLAIDATGNIYVADSNNDLIRKITPAGVVSTIAGNGTPGSKNGKAFASRNNPFIKLNLNRRRINAAYKHKFRFK